jgi:predicted acetyltransferase
LSAPEPIIEIIPANLAQQPVVANLFELYAHDFSEFHDVEVGEDGRFGYKHLPLYWQEPNRHPFLVRADGKLAGFVFIKGGSEVSADAGVWDMAEFFVLRAFRGRGIGTRIAHEVWRRFPGPWEIRVMEANESASRFWQRAVTAFAGENAIASGFEKNGERWRLHAFNSRPASEMHS